jgi:hypothetical protein
MGIQRHLPCGSLAGGLRSAQGLPTLLTYHSWHLAVVADQLGGCGRHYGDGFDRSVQITADREGMRILLQFGIEQPPTLTL